MIFLEKLFTRAVNENEVHPHDIDVWIIFQEKQLRFNPFGKSNVVTIEIRNICTKSKSQSPIASKSDSPIGRITDKAYPVVARAIMLDNMYAAIMGCIIDNNELEICK